MCKVDYNCIILSIAKRVRAIRTSRKMTVQELAYRCDMERSNLSRIESGRVNITIRTLCIIATALEVNILDLITPENIDECKM